MKTILLLLGLGIMLIAKTQTIVFSAGCFWGVEKHFEQIDGVRKATSGYAGGDYDNPTYERVLMNRHAPKGVINHAESVEVVYDENKVSTEVLIKSFWEMHDPTQGNRQGNDIGNNYRSAIYYTTPEQMQIALSTKRVYQKLLSKAGFGKITTEIKPLKKFYPAEAYHQNYLKKNPFGYCPNHATGVKFDKNQKITTATIAPLDGKEIVVIEAEHCRFCEKFKKNVTDHYNGTIPLITAHQDALKGFKLKTKIEGTPTIIFIEDGKEVEAYTGYMDEKSFYKAVGAFKLGKNSEGYDVAFHQKTDGRFCKKYEEFKHTGDGVFRDKVSGDILFDTRDRFNSGSGWLSFFKAVEGATIQKEDNSFGMHRVEVIAKKSGAHLGHVFNDAPGGRQRFCINATVLEFVPRDKIKK
ncbi:peptide-methionine (S)-S-oxide reductase MsrA [Sulfurovum sp.]|uniref:peptide-methionine (S)-S-oxide reductase MsrA n=1 Tax=Sulfurovum sp. TaxID=1969726 RepID=UPI0025D89AD2|nr:peptide-methionine (S)-S-oxide reductase MsrA [Sulfurovum sp.]